MAAVNRTVATLRVSGELLDPDEITAILGALPSASQKKGEIRVGHVSGQTRTIRIGMWRLRAADKIPGDLDEQIGELLSALTADLSVWKKLGERFRLDMFCGLFMNGSNEGLSISPRC